MSTNVFIEPNVPRSPLLKIMNAAKVAARIGVFLSYMSCKKGHMTTNGVTNNPLASSLKAHKRYMKGIKTTQKCLCLPKINYLRCKDERIIIEYLMVAWFYARWLMIYTFNGVYLMLCIRRFGVKAKDYQKQFLADI